jgi:AcrR family transcriptional regulator
MTTTTGAARDPLTERGRRTRQGLVAAARVVFEKNGFAAARMGDIAEQAGVSHGTVYTYFDTKEDLLAASVKQLVADIRASIRTTESDHPAERVWNANHRYLTAYLGHARLMSVVEEAGAAEQQFAEIVADLRWTHASRVASQIRKLQSADLVPDEIDPESAAQALCAMVEGFARNWTEQVRSDLVGSTQTLTQLWINCLGLNMEPGNLAETSTTNLEATDAVHTRA